MPINSFQHVSAAISVAGTPDTDPTLEVLLRPAACNLALSRVVLHETVHFWQYLSSAYLAEIAMEDWERLKQFEQDGTAGPPGLKRQHFIERETAEPFRHL